MWLVDTNVISELRKIESGRANAQVARWADSVSPNELFVSVISLYELERGIGQLARRDIAQAEILRHWFEMQVMPAFSGRILSVNEPIAIEAAKRQVPNPYPIADSFIAATAHIHGLTIVTRNTKDFVPMIVSLVNPWSAPSAG